jgi:hypothetical protein
MTPEEIDENYETFITKNKCLRIYPCGTIEMKDGKNWIELVPQKKKIESLDIKDWVSCMKEYMYVDTGNEQIPVVYLVCRAFHPDVTSYIKFGRCGFMYRNKNIEDCSIGNIVMMMFKK